MGLSQRESGRPVAPVASSWERIEAWVENESPSLYNALRPGISEGDISRLEQAVGFSIPQELRESYLIHDAYRMLDAPEEDEGLDLFFCNLPLVEHAKAWWAPVLMQWQEQIEQCRQAPELADDPSVQHPWYHWKPDGFIRRAQRLPGWMPLHYDGGGNYVGVDLEPGPKGQVGQVINFGRDEKVMYVLAHSWGQFLEDIADEMEAGNFFVEEFEGIKLRTPKEEPLYTQYRAWSEAKIGIPIQL